ncbi:17.6 kDa class I heat shock protein-like [Zingiber officinale]|uniref:17.6 kDa class I heat shock protein-like n=1 Tax=Zingiber officinale TaxID=94328 RepID=UPI001C4B1D7C|nr:17.6 kDa class I heat shock protein-like [Zingiber officinale]
MEMMVQLAAKPPRKYLDFDPQCTWTQDENSKVLIVDIPGFKKEQLTILIDTRRKLEIKGERYIEGGQLTRFNKHLLAPKHCDIKNIRATFDVDNGLLCVTLPRSASHRSFGVDDIKDKNEFRTSVFSRYNLKKMFESLCKKLCVKIDVKEYSDGVPKSQTKKE